MPHDKICAHCGKPFTADKRTREFCSYACLGASKRKPPITSVCVGCGKTFQSERRERSYSPLYCSRSCYIQHPPRKIDRPAKTCPQCGKEFVGRNAVHCSRACQMAAQRTRVTRICIVCGFSFERCPSVIAKGDGRFCSQACAHAYQMQQRIQCTCLHCGRQFEVVPSDLNYRTPRFCSATCNRKYVGETAPEQRMRNTLERLALRFEAQFPFLRYHLDFYLPEHQLAIEVDGTYWHKKHPERDAKRDATLLSHGIRTIRFAETEIDTTDDLPSLVLSKLFP